MQNRELEQARRRRRAHQRLPGDRPRCGICGFDNVLSLEAHHVAGQKYDDETVVLCRNCHRIASDLQKDHPLQVENPPGFSERLVHFLEGLADLLEIIVKSLRRFAQELHKQLFSKKEQSNEL